MNSLKNFVGKRKLATILFGTTIGGGLCYFGYEAARQKSLKVTPKSQESLYIDESAVKTGVLYSDFPIKNVQLLQQEEEQKESSQVQQNESGGSRSESEHKYEKQALIHKGSAKTPQAHFEKFYDIEQYDISTKIGSGQLMFIVADLPYTGSFQQKMLAEVNSMAAKYPGIRIYRQNILHTPVKDHFEQQFKAKISQQTLFLLKNGYDKVINNIDFDLYMQHPRILDVYLKAVQNYESGNIKQLKNKLERLSPYESCVLYLYDKDENSDKLKERFMTAKFVEMEIMVNNLNGVKVEVVERNAAVSTGLIEAQNNRTNSLHLFRKHNKYTPFDPNFDLILDNKKSCLFYRLSDIALFQKGSNSLMIPSYLNGLETFDSLQMSTPFLCSLWVDRNKISEGEYNKLLAIFGEFKRNNTFPDVAFSLKLKEIPYPGKDNASNSSWQINLMNMDELDKQSMMHEITNSRQLQMLGIRQQKYLKESQEYLYEHNLIDKNLITEFLKKGQKGQLPKHYKSQQHHILSNIKKLSGQRFQADILQDNSDHLVYEYSQSCPTCKKISPLLSGIVDIVRSKGLGLGDLQFHRIDANKNRALSFLSSPYIPNIYYFKKDWKQFGPVRFPIDMLSSQGVVSLYHFCLISKQVETVSWQVVQNAIRRHKKYHEQQ